MWSKILLSISSFFSFFSAVCVLTANLSPWHSVDVCISFSRGYYCLLNFVSSQVKINKMETTTTTSKKRRNVESRETRFIPLAGI